ncbi:MAG: hypothetical protein EAZ92_17530 [Candidatus Kapaibacterium sp.]|nr:MAG: hypothetical protein EAZ92_17530 [Candidatus Kapabacteria bacterium]
MLLPVCFPLFDAFRPVFTRSRTHQLVCGILVGMMLAVGDVTMTNVYLSLMTYAPDTLKRYWSLEQVLRRRQWQVEDLIAAFVSFLLSNVVHGRFCFIADGTHTTTQGKKQEARGFRPNPHYRKGYQNQSKFLAGNDILSLSLLMDEATESGRIQRFCFALGGVLLRAANKRTREIPTFIRLIKRIVPKGSVILFDRKGNDAKTINALADDYCYITRLNANAVFYRDSKCKEKFDIKEQALAVEKRKQDKVYRSHHICYRRGVKKPVLVVAEWFYNRPKRRWRIVYYLCTSTELKPERVIEEYTLRRSIETTHSDSKLFTGFEDCRLHSKESIEAWCCLSRIATGILEYLRWRLAHSTAYEHSTDAVLDAVKMHWYHPHQLTRGLVCAFLRHSLLATLINPKNSEAGFFCNQPLETLSP